MVITNKETRRLLRKKLSRDIIENKKQFISIIAISFLAIALFCGLTANYKYLDKRVNNLYNEGNMGDLFITVSPYDENDITKIKKIESIADVSIRSNLDASYDGSNICVLVNEINNKISVPIIKEGTNGFLVDKNFATSKGIKVGDRIKISFINVINVGLRSNDEGKLLLNYISNYKIEGKEDIFNLSDVLLEIEVTGIMMHPEAVENSNFTSAFAYTDFEYMKDIFDKAIIENYYEQVNTLIEKIPLKELLVNQIIAKAENYSETVLEIDEYFSNKENNNLIINLTRDTLSSNISVQEDIVQARKMTYVFPTIFFIVSVLVILTTLSQMIVRERGQIGTMKAIGLSKMMIIYHYMNYGIALCLIGSILGVIVGPILLPEVMNIKYKLLWELPDIKPDLFHLEYIVCIALLLLLGALVSYLVCRSELI